MFPIAGTTHPGLRRSWEVPIEQVPELLGAYPTVLEGLHFHTNSDSLDYGELLDNVLALSDAIPKWQGVKWVNLGGGYLLDGVSLDPLVEAAELIKLRFGAEVFIEPGAGLVRAAGYLIGSVLDILAVDGKRIAVLDTTVNHMPEVLGIRLSTRRPWPNRRWFV